MHTIEQPFVTGPLPITIENYPFSTMDKASKPLDLQAFGYVEEEYLLSGNARVYEKDQGSLRVVDTQEYCTRVLVRRPTENPSSTAWVSILNASQGYDIEDDWRRAWDYMIANRDTYVGVSSKPIQSSALKSFNPNRYESLNWGGSPHEITAAPSWNPFQTLEESEEGLIWDILASTSSWLRSGSDFQAPSHLFMMGQSQSAIYTNTYLSFIHPHLRLDGGEPTYDGYLPGVGATFTRALHQNEAVDRTYAIDGGFIPQLTETKDIDVPVIRISSEGDIHLFPRGENPFIAGDGTLSRHWNIAGSPHSDPRSRVIPENSEVVKASRLPRVMDQAYLESISVLPIEPFITASMTAIRAWALEGKPAPASSFFDSLSASSSVPADGGIILGLLAHPLADFQGAAENPVIGSMKLHSASSVLEKFPTFKDYQDACDLIDDQLEAAGYLEPHGRGLLHAIEQELWDRCVNGAPASRFTPQSVAY